MNVLRPSDVILSSFVNKEQLPLDFFLWVWGEPGSRDVFGFAGTEHSDCN